MFILYLFSLSKKTAFLSQFEALSENRQFKFVFSQICPFSVNGAFYSRKIPFPSQFEASTASRYLKSVFTQVKSLSPVNPSVVKISAFLTKLKV